MRTLFLTLAALIISTSAFAGEITASYDYYITPNEGNNYDDGQGVSIGYDHSITGPVRGVLVGSHITDIHFPVADDPKGSFGELRSYGVGYRVYAGKDYSEKLRLMAGVGIGYHDWDFRENPFLQDNRVNVDVDPSISYEAFIGGEYDLKDDWTLFCHLGWFDTDIKKDARDNTGREWNILDDGNISLRYITTKAGVKVKF